MRKAVLIGALLCALMLCGCDPALKSEEDIINKSREYLSYNIGGLSIGGNCSDNDKTLF